MCGSPIGAQAGHRMTRRLIMIERNQIFINGKWVDSSGSEVLTVINPANGDQPG
jgi:hypothetical protein